MIKAAVIGLGWWGRLITTTLKDSDKIEVIRIAARTPSKHQNFADETGIKLMQNYSDVLADKEVEAVILCTPHSQHESQVMDAIAAGKQIFCEKPLGLTKASVSKMVSAARKAGIQLGIGHERRFEASMEAITKHVKSDAFGTAMHAEANFSHSILVGVDADSWRGSLKEAPAAGMTGMGVHLTDLFISMFGPVEQLCAQTAQRVLPLPTGDIVNVQFKFKSGATAFLAAISATPYYGRFSVFGDKLWVEARDTAHPQEGGETQIVMCGPDGKQSTQTYPPRNAVKANLHEWADAVLGHGEYRFTDEQLIGNVAVLEAIAQSVEKGGWVKL